MPHSRHRSMRVAACLGIAGLTAVATAGPAASTEGVAVWLGFDDEPGVVAAPANYGAASTTQRVISAGGGVIRVAGSPSGHGGVAEFPAFDGRVDGPRAVLVVGNSGGADRLSPGGSSFVFGADVNLADPSQGSEFDDGNNVIQRGLFGDAAQYKLEVDAGVASCRVKGDRGALLVTSSVSMGTDSWYRLRCTRLALGDDELLALTVTTLSGGAKTDESVRDIAWGPIGALSMDTSTLLSVGGKVGRNQNIVAASDQFNGRLDNVFLISPAG
ncbi:MAG: hypothetical protein ACRCYQ_08875 [Nocardioides sp.]